MTKAIIFKEWLKTRRTFLIELLVAMLMAAYAIMCIRRVATSHGVEHVWLIMLMKDQTFIDSLKYLPPVLGLVLALTQMVPETRLKRLKLTLHLPVSNRRVIATMLGVGVAELLTIFILQLGVVAGYYATVITPEMTLHVVLTTLPWYIAGVIAYMFGCAACLEGRWRRRVVIGLLGLASVSVFYLQNMPQAYNGMIIGAVVFCCLLVWLSFLSVIRFKEGLID